MAFKRGLVLVNIVRNIRHQAKVSSIFNKFSTREQIRQFVNSRFNKQRSSILRNTWNSNKNLVIKCKILEAVTLALKHIQSNFTRQFNKYSLITNNGLDLRSFHGTYESQCLSTMFWYVPQTSKKEEFIQDVALVLQKLITGDHGSSTLSMVNCTSSIAGWKVRDMSLSPFKGKTENLVLDSSVIAKLENDPNITEDWAVRAYRGSSTKEKSNVLKKYEQRELKTLIPQDGTNVIFRGLLKACPNMHAGIQTRQSNTVWKISSSKSTAVQGKNWYHKWIQKNFWNASLKKATSKYSLCTKWFHEPECWLTVPWQRSSQLQNRNNVAQKSNVVAADANFKRCMQDGFIWLLSF